MEKPAQPGMKFGKLTTVYFDKGRRKWLCQCDCGGTTYANITDMRNGIHISCKCTQKEKTSKRFTLPENVALKNRLFKRYQQSAKYKGLEFNLSFDELIEISSKECFYCGRPPVSLLESCGKTLYYNGIDRVDNSLGYSTNNCVASCYMCNTSKNKYNLEDWVKWVYRIYHNMDNNKMFNDQSKDVDSSESKWETPLIGW